MVESLGSVLANSCRDPIASVGLKEWMVFAHISINFRWYWVMTHALKWFPAMIQSRRRNSLKPPRLGRLVAINSNHHHLWGCGIIYHWNNTSCKHLPAPSVFDTQAAPMGGGWQTWQLPWCVSWIWWWWWEWQNLLHAVHSNHQTAMTPYMGHMHSASSRLVVLAGLEVPSRGCV